MQYTLRNIPEALDRALRAKAKREGRSLNEVAIEAMNSALGTVDPPARLRDLDDVAGSWREDQATEDALEDQRKIDPGLWD